MGQSQNSSSARNEHASKKTKRAGNGRDMKTIITELKERLELVDKGQLPYCETDADKVAMYASQEAELDAMVAVAKNLKRDLATERASYEACIDAARRAA